MVKIAVITGNSASGLACMQTLLARAIHSTNQVSLVRGCFRRQGKAATTRSSLPLQRLGKNCQYEAFPYVDASDPDTLRRALEGMDRALLVTPLDYTAGMQDDAAKSIRMIQAAQQVGVQRIVHVGSWTVQAPKDLPLLSSRFVPTEEYLQSEIGTSLEWTVLRGGYFMSNLAHVHGASIRTHKTLLSLPDCFVPPVDVRDIGEAAAALLGGDHDDQYATAYNQTFVECCGPQLLSHGEMAAELSAGVGVSIHYPNDAPTIENWSGSDNPILSELYHYMASGDGKRLPFDPEPFAQVLGRSPTTLREWASDQKQAFL
jgi:uncharacterized protein YbjT (DUF2867 family)